MLKKLCLFLLAVAALLSPDNTAASTAFDSPLHSAAVALFLAGSAVLYCLDRYALLLARSHGEGPLEDQAALPLADSKWQNTNVDESDTPTVTKTVHWARVLGSAVLLSARIALFHHVQKVGNTRCQPRFIAYELLPFLLLVAEWALSRSPEKRFKTYAAPLELISCTLAVSWAHFDARLLHRLPASTFICGKFEYAWLFQSVGLLLDCAILLLARSMFRVQGQEKIKKSLDALGTTLLISSLLTAVLAWSWIGGATMLNDEYWISLLWCSAPAIAVGYYGSHMLVEAEAFDVTALTFFASTCTMLFSVAWKSHSYVLPKIWPYLVKAFLILHLACYMRHRCRAGWLRSSSGFAALTSKLHLFLGVLEISLICLTISSNTTFDIHPINLLIESAASQHTTWLGQASSSGSLQNAEQEYRRRYGRSPPPGFDKWYEYARERHSLVIDDFDSIHQNLLPFWAELPHDLRRLTHELTADRWTDAAKLSIRGGKIEIGDMPGTHRWMLDGIAKMIENFSQWLPDMDIAFNLNDEPRVAVPYEAMQKHISQSVKQGQVTNKPPLENVWSEGRAEAWTDTSLALEEYFVEASRTNIFSNFGSVSCAPDSTARTSSPIQKDAFCMDCIAPHTMGGFVRNWTLAGSVCHQPDLRSLHGFFASPAAFKGTNKLVPLFSQGTTRGFADILYPSAWNYVDNAVYRPDAEHPERPFFQKENTLFWRGGTSEGLSATNEGVWRGMARQRFVNLGALGAKSIPTLLPQQKEAHRLGFQYVADPAAHTNTKIDAAIVDKIVRCEGQDCVDETAELRIVEGMNFQDHWKYRYLMDMDGAGFSGRFLPFLWSNSLPFKAALFREWYDSRIVAWKHFVPIDLRFHDVWNALIFFDSGEEERGKAEAIALEGKEWAQKVTRKADMEIYFFRLLLEWGRLTDDRRDEIGFVGARNESKS